MVVSGNGALDLISPVLTNESPKAPNEGKCCCQPHFSKTAATPHGHSVAVPSQDMCLFCVMFHHPGDSACFMACPYIRECSAYASQFLQEAPLPRIHASNKGVFFRVGRIRGRSPK